MEPKQELKLIECCLSNDNHFAFEPVSLECGSNCCKKCINELKEAKVQCKHCSKILVKAQLEKLKINETLKARINTVYKEKIAAKLKERFKLLNDYIKGNKLEKMFDEECDTTKWFKTMDTSITEITNQLHKIHDKFKEEYKNLHHNVLNAIFDDKFNEAEKALIKSMEELEKLTKTVDKTDDKTKIKKKDKMAEKAWTNLSNSSQNLSEIIKPEDVYVYATNMENYEDLIKRNDNILKQIEFVISEVNPNTLYTYNVEVPGMKNEIN